MAPTRDLTRPLPCWLDVDLDAIAGNVQALQRWVGPQTAIAAVVKAQAYGVGAEAVARAAIAGGASWLAVARIHEGEQLRADGIAAPILVLTRTDPAEADEAVRSDLSVTVDTLELGRALCHAAQKAGRRARVHVKVDSGLHRFGVEPAQALPLTRGLSELDHIEVEALYTHFANADESDPTYTVQQLKCFNGVTDALEDAGYRFPIRHACNSAATLGYPDAHLDLVRTGLALYGTSPSGSVPEGLSLRPAVSLKARIARISCLATGEGVGYGQIWHAARPTRVALVTAGYADGIPRQVTNEAHVLIHGRSAPIIGRVSMDQTTVDVTDVLDAKVGDAATFFGTEGEDGPLSLTAFSRAASTIEHAILTGIGGRVARIYHRNGDVESGVRITQPSSIAARPIDR